MSCRVSIGDDGQQERSGSLLLESDGVRSQVVKLGVVLVPSALEAQVLSSIAPSAEGSR